MLTNKLLKLPILALAIATLGLACSDSNNSGGSATVNGKVEESQAKQKSADLEGTVVTLATVESNGSINKISDIETTTNASGEFNLSFDANTAQHYVVVAQNGSSETMGFVSASLENGDNVTIKPIDFESTAESNVYAELVANGSADIVTKNDIEVMITSRVASEINNSTSAAAKFATALKSSAEARAEFFRSEVEGNAEEKLEASLQILADAQARLEADLNSASTAEQEAAAYELFVETSANAYANADVEANKAAQAIELWGRLAVNNVSSVSTEAENSVREQTSMMAAIAIDAAVRAEAEASEMSSESKQAIADAGATLKANIRTAAGVKADVEAAFESYKEEVNTTMQNDANVSSEFVVSVDTEINATTGAKTIFDSAVASAVTADVALDVYTTFFSSVESSAQNNDTQTMSDATLSAVTKIIILTSLQS
jgi:CRISPR/Cas system CMR-associated protein Cmr5 small subunit